MTGQEIESHKRFEDVQKIMHEAYMKVRGEVEEALVRGREDVESETERCAKCVSEELAEWNSGGEHYDNVTKACESIEKRIRGRK